jgi:polar amino acid transport system permease protein
VAEVDRQDQIDPDRRPRILVTDGALIPDSGDKVLFSAWNISFFGALALLVLLPLFRPKPYLEILKFVPDGLLNTFIITICSIACALLIGLLTGIGRISRNVVVNRVATIYVEIVRGVPLLVQLFYLYFALASFLRLPSMVAAVLSMSICYGAYMGEVFRAGILAVPRGQMEAALALGLSRGQAITKVILPQTIKIVLPPIGNEFIALLKDSSLVSILAIPDLLRRGREFASTGFQYFETYTMIALIYLILTLFFSRMVALMEKRLNRNGRK